MSVVGITRMYYAANMAQVGRAFANLTSADRYPVDPDRLRSEAGALVADRRISAEQYRAPEAAAILEAWAVRRIAERSGGGSSSASG
jgi:guanine deaminase